MCPGTKNHGASPWLVQPHAACSIRRRIQRPDSDVASSYIHVHVSGIRRLRIPIGADTAMTERLGARAGLAVFLPAVPNRKPEPTRFLDARRLFIRAFDRELLGSAWRFARDTVLSMIDCIAVLLRLTDISVVNCLIFNLDCLGIILFPLVTVDQNYLHCHQW